jgi:hypothetical protein
MRKSNWTLYLVADDLGRGPGSSARETDLETVIHGLLTINIAIRPG